MGDPLAGGRRTGERRHRLTETWRFLPKGIEGFRERFGDEADAEIDKRRNAARTGIPTTLAAIKKAAETG